MHTRQGTFIRVNWKDETDELFCFPAPIWGSRFTASKRRTRTVQEREPELRRLAQKAERRYLQIQVTELTFLCLLISSML
jgi:hypothetical protein